MKTFTTCAEKKAKQILNLLQGYTKGIRMTAILVLLLMGVSNAWGEDGFYEVYMVYSSANSDYKYTFKSVHNNINTHDLSTGTSPFVIKELYLKFWDNWNDKPTVGGQMCYKINNGATQYFGNNTWSQTSYSSNNCELQNSNCNHTVVSASGKYTFEIWWQMWGWGHDSWINNGGKNYTWTYTILPPAVSNIGISATGCIGGTGTQQDPYIVAYGASLKLTASVTNSDANSNTHFTFGSNTASTAKTHTISNITNATAQKITIKAQNINKSDKSLKGTALSKDIYYKYTPVYVYINGQSHQINTTTKQVTVALNRNANDETYTFKVHDDNNHWLGNSGTMERGGTSVHSEGWTMSVDDKNDCKLKADLTGDYTFTFIPATNKVTVTYPQKSYFIAGSWDNWAGTAPSFVDASTPVSIYLEADQTYSFKVADLTANAKWYGNDGTMTRAYSTAWDMSTDKDNCQITTDLAGNYDFTFNQSTKKLTVTYPTAYKMTYGINNAKYGTVKAEVNYKSVESGKYWYPNTEFTFSYELTKGTLFKGWYDNANGTGEPLSTNPIYTHTLGADANVYAVCEDGYKIQIADVTYYFLDHNGKHLSSLLIELNGGTTYMAPLKKGDTKADTGDGSYTAPVAGTYTCSINANKNGVIWTPPYKVGDYRLLYVDQVVEKGTGADSWKTVIRRTYEHPSDVVKKSATATRDVISLHIFTKHENPEVILQQYQTVESKNQWVDIEAHMVNGPLNALPGTAMLPGRKNAGEGSECDDFVYDDGIEIIKADDTDAGCGVWDFTIVQNGETATLDLTSNGLKRYTGKYYIRTSSAPGQWSNYQIPENQITESHYASENFRQNNPEFVENEYFTHYFCKYVDKTKTANVKFIIANKHGMAISKEFTQDAFTTLDGDLAGENANVRFAWNQITNTCKRAYIAGSFDKTNEFLYVKPEDENKVTTKENTNGVKGYFNDNTNWLYYADVLAQSGAKAQVVAKYNGKYQYFMGAESGADQYEQLIGGTDNSTNYPIRIMYEFPEHRFVVAYMPPSTITGDVAIETPIMLIRENHGEANQITFSDNDKKITAPLPAYGTITFTEGHLKNNNTTIYDKALYWISFPFDVQISDVFGFGKYGEDWIIEYYDGKRRSEVGLTYYNTFWEYNWRKDFVMKAGQGYVLCLELDKVLTHFLDGKNDSEEISLYFPSMENIAWGDIKSQDPSPVKINEWKTNKTKEKDHNWNLIGVVSYANTGESTQQDNTNFLYEYVSATDTYTPRTSNGYEFKALHAYMVQYAGDIKWTSHIAPKAIAAKENATSEDEIHRLSLDLIYNDKTLDQTFFQLEDGEATQMFDLNIDMTKIINSGANIYSISSDNNQLAGNVLPIQETVIPVGVVISAAGEYTFAMPEGTDGIVVELIDYETNTRTNMLLDNYTVNLGKGTNETRFALHVKPDKTTTSLEDVNTNTTGVKKYLIDGILYMQKDGALYDAQGKLVR